MPCDRCGGDGQVAETPCEVCDGAGRVVRQRTWEVEVPAGIESGQRIRIAGAGHAGDAGARPGDLYVEVLVAEDERFDRQGTELVTPVELPVTPRCSAAGDRPDPRRRARRSRSRRGPARRASPC